MLLAAVVLHHYVMAPSLGAALDEFAQYRIEEYGYDAVTTIRAVERDASRRPYADFDRGNWERVDLAEAEDL